MIYWFTWAKLGFLDHKRNVYVGFHITRDYTRHCTQLDQTRYILKTLYKLGYVDAHVIIIPKKLNACLEDATHQDQKFILNFPYNEIVECFFFASFDIMPNLSYVMGIEAKYNNQPMQTPCNIVSRIMKYFSGH
jgi:hypothetical protein